MLQAGERIDEWIVDAPIGPGGRGSVYRCRHASAEGVHGVLKLLDADGLSDAGTREGLDRTVQLLQGLKTAGLVRVVGARLDQRPAYLVMDEVDGERLSARIQRVGPRTADEAMPLLEQLAERVATLHARGVAHGDLKPANVRIDEDGRAVLVDFGLVLGPGAKRLTADGLSIGTVSYVPPEWADPSSIDPLRWDVYSLGTMFWEILVGRRAFPLPDDTDPRAAALQVMSVKRGHPSLDPGPDAPFFLRMLIREMTNADPAGRPADASEVLERLRAGEDGGVVDPVELFRTPMPAWQAEAGTHDHLSASGVPVAPSTFGGNAPDWWRSFVSGALLGGLVVSLIFAAGMGWVLGSRSKLPSGTPIPPDELPKAFEDMGMDLPAANAVSATEFASWVQGHPNWAREAAVAAGLTDEGYLASWEAGPPPGAAVHVSWYAARAYCEERGGLAELSAEPLEWEPNSGRPQRELRMERGRPAWRASDGRTSQEVDPIATDPTTGFRCQGS